MDDGTRGGGRTEQDWPPSLNPLQDQQSLEGELESMKARGRAHRNERWENYRQSLTMIIFALGAIFMVLALAASIFVLLLSPESRALEIAKWFVETFAGAIVAGFIAFWAVKSFER